MYEDNSVDEIMLIHVFEHLYLWEAMKALKEWYRVLKVGGKLTIEVPCLDFILEHFKNRKKDPYLTMFGLYGEQASQEEEMTHRWCYSKSQLTNDLKVAGFSDVKLKNAVYHRIERDIRVEGVK